MILRCPPLQLWSFQTERPFPESREKPPCTALLRRTGELARMTIRYLKLSVLGDVVQQRNTPSCTAPQTWQSRQRIHICVCVPLLDSPVGEKLLSPSCPPLQAVWDENLVNNSCFMVPCLPSAFQPQVTGIRWCQLPDEDSHPPLSYTAVQHS